MLVPSRMLSSVYGEAPAGAVEHEHVVGGDVAKTLRQAPLREVDLLAVPRREREVEVTSQLQRATAHVHAVGPRRSSAPGAGSASALAPPPPRP